MARYVPDDSAASSTATVLVGPDYGGPGSELNQALAIGVQTLLLQGASVEQALALSQRLVVPGADVQQVLEHAEKIIAGGAAVQQAAAASRLSFDVSVPTPTGTPDSDPIGDTWVDQASPGTTHGADVQLQVRLASAVPGSDANVGILEYDFTRFTGMTAYAGGIHETAFLTLLVSVNGVSSQTLNYRISHQATRPFIESTQGWPRPAVGTLVKNSSLSIASGAAALYTIGLTEAQMNQLVGQWAYIELTSGAPTSTSTFLVRSREGASSKPRCQFDLKG